MSSKSTLKGFLKQMLRSSLVIDKDIYIVIIFFNLGEWWQDIYLDFKE